jgi:shikimate dehydrogenase
VSGVTAPMSHPYPTLTLADLGSWPEDRVGLALLGHPVAHSFSPVIQNAALAELASADATYAPWQYAKFDVPPADLGRAIALLHRKGFVGLNLTTPHKEPVLDFVQSSDAFTRAASASNTLVRTENGWRACNTDGGGLADSLLADLQVALTGRDVILLGAGGAARAAAVQCLRDNVASIWIGNRSRERLDGLMKHLQALAGATPLHGFSTANPPKILPSGAVVINATTLGLKPDDPSPLDLRTIPTPGYVYDMTYNPPVTALLRQAATLGVPHANGLGMLVHQGARSLTLWSGRPVAADTMRAAADAAMALVTA